MARLVGTATAAALIGTAGLAREVAHEHTTHTVSVGLGERLRVRTTVGDVTVTGGDVRDIIIDIDRRAPSRKDLERLTSVVGRDTHGVYAAVEQAGGERRADVRGSIALRVPAAQVVDAIELFEGHLTLQGLTGGVSAIVERGDIDARGLAGPMRLETTLGSIVVDVPSPGLSGAIRLRTFNGDVRLRLAGPPPDARILALSLGGMVTSDIPLTLKTGVGPSFGEATIGRGEPPVSIDVVNGDIHLSGPRPAGHTR